MYPSSSANYKLDMISLVNVTASQYTPPINKIPITFVSSSATSSTVQVGYGKLCGIELPSGFTAKSVSFLAGNGTTPLFNVWANGTELQVIATGSAYTYIDYNLFNGVNYVAVRASSSLTPSSQNAITGYLYVRYQ